MISIIVSSYKEEYFSAFRDSVVKTIGVDYEIIKIHNPGLMGICEAYNQGARKAKYPYLCFVHEDVLMKTKGWGTRALAHFSLPGTGVIGVAGSKIKLPLPTGWTSGVTEMDFVNIEARKADGSTFLMKNWNSNQNKEEVKVLDGVFLMTTHKVWERFEFNERNKGFHFYDLEFCLEISKSYRCFVVQDILLEHYSMGNFGDDWVVASLQFNRKLRSTLTNRDKVWKKKARLFWYYRLAIEKISLLNKIKYCAGMGIKFDKSLKAMIRFLIVGK